MSMEDREEQIETYSTSLSMLINNRDYEIEALIEARSPTQAAVFLIRDWADLVKKILADGRELVVAVSPPNGEIEFFSVYRSMCIPLSNIDVEVPTTTKDYRIYKDITEV